MLDGCVDGQCGLLRFFGLASFGGVRGAAVAIAALFREDLAEVAEQELRAAVARLGVFPHDLNARAVDPFSDVGHLDGPLHRCRRVVTDRREAVAVGRVASACSRRLTALVSLRPRTSSSARKSFNRFGAPPRSAWKTLASNPSSGRCLVKNRASDNSSGR